jgi:hypothetical protein
VPRHGLTRRGTTLAMATPTKAAAAGTNGTAQDGHSAAAERLAKLREAMVRADGGRGVQVGCAAPARPLRPSPPSPNHDHPLQTRAPRPSRPQWFELVPGPTPPTHTKHHANAPLTPQAYIVPSEDPHMSEYPPDRFKRREFISRRAPLLGARGAC